MTKEVPSVFTFEIRQRLALELGGALVFYAQDGDAWLRFPTGAVMWMENFKPDVHVNHYQHLERNLPKVFPKFQISQEISLYEKVALLINLLYSAPITPKEQVKRYLTDCLAYFLCDRDRQLTWGEMSLASTQIRNLDKDGLLNE